MTNEPEMTLSQAQAWIKANWASENFDRYKFAEAKGFIFGHAAASKRVGELEHALKEAVDFISPIFQGNTHYPDKTVIELKLSTYLRAQEVLESARRVIS